MNLYQEYTDICARHHLLPEPPNIFANEEVLASQIMALRRKYHEDKPPTVIIDPPQGHGEVRVEAEIPPPPKKPVTVAVARSLSPAQRAKLRKLVKKGLIKPHTVGDRWALTEEEFQVLKDNTKD